MSALSDLYWLLLQPSSLVFILLLLSALLLMLRAFRAGRRLLVLTLVLALLPAALPLREWLAEPLETLIPMPATLPEQVTGIVVLGGSVDWRVTEARVQLALFGNAERMTAAASLARRYPEAQLVFTGLFGATMQGEFVPEWAVGRMFTGPEYAGRTILYLGEARSTYEEGLLTLQRLQPTTNQTWLLVTSALHMPRALNVFQTLGWRVVPYPVDFTTLGSAEGQLEPSLDILARLTALDSVTREWGALVLYERLGRTRTLLPARP